MDLNKVSPLYASDPPEAPGAARVEPVQEPPPPPMPETGPRPDQDPATRDPERGAVRRSVSGFFANPFTARFRGPVRVQAVLSWGLVLLPVLIVGFGQTTFFVIVEAFVLPFIAPMYAPPYRGRMKYVAAATVMLLVMFAAGSPHFVL